MKTPQFSLLFGLLVLVGCSSNVSSAASDLNAAVDTVCECDAFMSTTVCSGSLRVSDAKVECIETVADDFPEVTYECEATGASQLLDCVEGASCNQASVQACFAGLPSCGEGRSEVLQDRLQNCDDL